MQTFVTYNYWYTFFIYVTNIFLQQIPINQVSGRSFKLLEYPLLVSDTENFPRIDPNATPHPSNQLGSQPVLPY